MLVAPPFYACLSIMLICHVVRCFTYRDHCPAGRLRKTALSFSILFLFFVIFSFLYFIIIVYCERSFFTEMMTHSLYKTDWELDPSLHNTRPGVGSTPQTWVCATSTGVVFSRFCPLRSKIEYDFRGSHALNKLIYLFNSKQLQMDTKERKINEIYHSNRV